MSAYAVRAWCNEFSMATSMTVGIFSRLYFASNIERYKNKYPSKNLFNGSTRPFEFRRADDILSVTSIVDSFALGCTPSHWAIALGHRTGPSHYIAPRVCLSILNNRYSYYLPITGSNISNVIHRSSVPNKIPSLKFPQCMQKKSVFTIILMADRLAHQVVPIPNAQKLPSLTSNR